MCGMSYSYGVATASRLLKIIVLFCKRALWNRPYSAKETYNLKEPTNRSHPIWIFADLFTILLPLSHSLTRTHTHVHALSLSLSLPLPLPLPLPVSLTSSLSLAPSFALSLPRSFSHSCARALFLIDTHTRSLCLNLSVSLSVNFMRWMFCCVDMLFYVEFI